MKTSQLGKWANPFATSLIYSKFCCRVDLYNSRVAFKKTSQCQANPSHIIRPLDFVCKAKLQPRLKWRAATHMDAVIPLVVQVKFRFIGYVAKTNVLVPRKFLKEKHFVIWSQHFDSRVAFQEFWPKRNEYLFSKTFLWFVFVSNFHLFFRCYKFGFIYLYIMRCQCKIILNIEFLIQYTSVNWNTQGTRHFVQISECSQYRKLRKNQEF